MKMIYSSPTLEEILINVNQTILLGSVEKEDITDGPVDIIGEGDLDPDDDGEW